MISFKKILGISLAACMLLTGCGRKETITSVDKGTDKVTAMGRYVETALNIPYKVEEESYISFLLDKDKVPQLYTQSKEDTSVYYHYTYQSDGTWQKEEAVWLSAYVKNKAENLSLGMVSTGADGNLYACFAKEQDGDYFARVVKSTDGQTAEEIKLEGLDKPNNRGFIDILADIKVMENGRIAGSTYSDVTLYDQQGKKLIKFPFSPMKSMTVWKNNFITADDFQQPTKISIIDSETLTTTQEIPIDNGAYGAVFTADDEGNIFMADMNGIHRMAAGGSIWETLLNGTMATMSMPSLSMQGFDIGKDNDFYIMYGSTDGQGQLMYYHYDKTIPAVPDKELTIYSLNENSTVRQAAVEFQRENPDVKVNFRAAMLQDSTVTVSDTIRALNTELLNGKGADILLLDGLPIKSYIEKGVLADISDTMKPMVQSGKILSNIAEAFQEPDGKQYAMPIRIEVPTMWAKQEILEKAKTLDDIAQLAKESSQPIIRALTPEGLVKNFYTLNAHNFVNKDNTMNKDGLIQFLNNLKAIRDSAGHESEEERSGSVMGISDVVTKNNPKLLAITQNKGFQGSMLDFAMLDTLEGGAYNTVNNVFVPIGKVGINSASSQQEIAKKFLEALFSPSVQSTDLYDGFPVSLEGIEYWNTSTQDVSVSASFGDSDEFFTAEWPSEEIRREYTGLLSTLTIPAPDDAILLNMITEEASGFFDGSKTAQETAQQITDKAKAYLAE